MTRVWIRCTSGLVHSARIGDLANVLFELVDLVLEEHDAHRVRKTRLALGFLRRGLVGHCWRGYEKEWRLVKAIAGVEVVANSCEYVQVAMLWKAS